MEVKGHKRSKQCDQCCAARLVSLLVRSRHLLTVCLPTAERAVNENVTLPYLRSVEHKDWKGDPIVDPDVSNPTRPRMERPLDTIRSFEAAIDNAHKRKAQMNRSGKPL